MTGNRRIPLRILHTSDFHLSSHGDEGCRSLEAVKALAINNKVDLLIIAGDLFDHNKVEDELVRFTADKLREIALPIVVLAGNHDCLSAGSAFDRAELWQDCENIRIFRSANGEVVDFPDLEVSLWGKSICSEDHDVRPLEGIPLPSDNGRWNIAVAHGYYVSTSPPLFPSYHITKEEIAGLKWDYIALGHVPVFRCISSDPATYYSGSPSFSGTAALVEFSEENGTVVTRCLL